ncbi:elongation factor EF-1 gamma subunit [Kluyveromyces marxianus]|nr:elongation factor EF-1 gamma subunit [Kluyveromyces marxianus]KAG0677653.1 elongation factor EF-1 gamma subunit [Kluyveromyces marxianus]
MAQNTLYVLPPSPRSVLILALAKYLKIDVDVVDITKSKDEKFTKAFPLGKAPAFIGENGFKLHEVIAIAYYFVNLSEDEELKAALLGKNAKEEAEILKWISLSNSDFPTSLFGAIMPITGRVPYNKKVVDTNLEKLASISAVYEARLKNYTYLVDERITLADLFAAGVFTAGFATLMDAKWRADHPAIVRWFKTVAASPIVAEYFSKTEFVEEAIKYTPPKKEKKEQPKKEQPKKEAKPAAAAEADAAPAEPKKPKHPLELLGKSTFSLDEWKRTYSNEDTRPVALPWFWEHYNPEEYSIYRVDYKYNDELTLTFMSNNLVGGFFNRLSASVKYMFGCLVVYGENNNNGIVGAVMVRGQDFAPAFDVAPDWESYSYTKLDPTKEEDKEFINNMWAWDKPVVVNGENKEIVDGKVLK